ncbi:NUDIX hydrolase [Celeribacter arenosi]|uniref:NUDIX hydrolase n=1 Tax=Celeribacter arenosi TaxID=792649 RepID=A0ABP7K3F2_9RHOB
MGNMKKVGTVASREQVAALCYRKGKNGKEILLVTSRDTGRWIIPKGWQIDGLADHESAAQEAWEEAGVRPEKVRGKPVGTYSYDKRHDDGTATPVEATVYPVKVKKLEKDYPEVDERTREWVAPKTAAKRVDEPELKAILKDF